MASDSPPPAARRSRDPQESRRALLEAAASIFNSEGYFATDTNRIARAAGYAPGTFYTHFPDKLAIFLAVYESWVDEEVRIVQATLAAEDDKRPARQRLAEAVLAHHRRWRVFRASLRALYATDPRVRAVRLRQRERQIALNEELLSRDGRTPPSRARILAMLLTFEALCDAIADGDAAILAVDETALVELLAEELGRLR